MLVKFGGGVTQMSGSIGGTTFARNRFGNYGRARTKPVNPNSPSQVVVRSALSYLTERWNGALMAAQRTAWETYAQAVSMKNRIGEVVNLTGFNHYVRSNMINKQLGLAIVDDAPTELVLPEKDSTFAAAISEASQKATITFDEELDWVDEDGAYLFIFQGVPQVGTRNYFRGPWHYMGKVTGNHTTPPETGVEIDVHYTAVEGQKVWFMARIVRADGRITEKFFCTCTVAA